MSYALRPSVEVGGKLAIRNLAEVKKQMRMFLSMGMRKCQLLCFVQSDGRARLFGVVTFCRKYIEQEPELVAWIREEGQRIKRPNDMLFVRIDDAAERKYVVGVLDQPKRRVLSLPMRQKMGLH